MDVCDVCGFDFDSVGRDDVGPRVAAAAETIAALLVQEPENCLMRPSEERWSMIEYGAHVRDVLLTIRDRLVIGLVEHDPGFKPLYRDERINLGLYSQDTPAAVVAELGAATAMFVRLFDTIEPELLSRPVQYGSPNPQPRTLLWMGLQAIHESEHHLTDIEENLERVKKAR